MPRRREEHFRMGRLECCFIDDRHLPLVEVNADVAFDPRERVLLTDRDQDIIARGENVFFARRDERAFAGFVVLGLDLFEGHANELTVFDDEGLRNVVVDDRDVFVLSIFFFPRRCFHRREGRANNHLHILAAKSTRRAAAVHRRISAAEHDHAFADLVGVLKRHPAEPVDANVNVRRTFLSAGQIGQIAATRCTSADKNGVVIFFQNTFQRIDVMIEVRVNS